MNSDSFQSKIKKYADELLKMNKDRPSDYKETPKVTKKENAPAEDEISSKEEEISLSEEETVEITGTDEAVKEKTDDFAYFSARVFTGNNAYPVKNARVIITRDNKLFTYLSTDKSGTTGRIKLPSYPESNSLTPDSDRQSIEYRGEVYAVGFTPRKNLLISAVGGSDIVLDIQMTPLSERVN